MNLLILLLIGFAVNTLVYQFARLMQKVTDRSLPLLGITYITFFGALSLGIFNQGPLGFILSNLSLGMLAFCLFLFLQQRREKQQKGK
ncbi:hypothetical protein CHL76_02765 [Marinococcus halophilus]|nr:hypothetical protein [Marinococcus halophilus]OZT81296.1 hypothetical protein CHL76_02765 [Marinococcus halophilus]